MGQLERIVEDIYALLEESRGIRRKLLTEIKQLREGRLQELHHFLDEEYPKTNESGWFQRAIERGTILDFLVKLKAAKVEDVNPTTETTEDTEERSE